MGSKLTGFKNGVVCTAYTIISRDKKSKSVFDKHTELREKSLSDDGCFVAGLLATYGTVAITGSYAILYGGMYLKQLLLP